MTYERLTAASMPEVLERAEAILTGRLPIRRVDADRHRVRLAGGDGMVEITVHRHGLDTHVLAETDQLRTSRLDTEVQFFLTVLPYQPGDSKLKGEATPGGLTRPS